MIAYTKLKLLKNNYDDLTKDGAIRKKNVLVFQFTYPVQSSDFPTLKAYAMKRNHQDIPGTVPMNLDYADTKPTTYLSVPGEQVLGDMQAKYGDVEQLKKDSNPGRGQKENYNYLLFTPKFDGANYHVYFEISVIPSTNPDITTKTLSLNPSPPAGAN